MNPSDVYLRRKQECDHVGYNVTTHGPMKGTCWCRKCGSSWNSSEKPEPTAALPEKLAFTSIDAALIDKTMTLKRKINEIVDYLQDKRQSNED